MGSGDGQAGGGGGQVAPAQVFRAVVGPYRLGGLLLRIAEQKLTERLLLNSDRVERTVHFHSGYPVFSHSTQFAERLGPIAVRMSLVSREQLARALAAAKQGEHELGHALLELGYVNGSQLFALLGEQLVEQLGAACGADEARARFFADPGELNDVIILRLHPMTAVMAAVRNLSDAERKSQLADIEQRPVTSKRLPALICEWLGQVGYQADASKLLEGGPTIGGLTERIAAKMHSGTDYRFSPQQLALPQTRHQRPGNTAAPFGSHAKRAMPSGPSRACSCAQCHRHPWTREPRS